MARKLPWLSVSTKGPKDKTESSATTPRPPKCRKVEAAQSDAEDENDDASDASDASGASSTSISRSKAAKNAIRAHRNHSSSPPTSPPRQDFMRAGLEQDDIWVMVEDEFLSTAHLYTSHLHKAEYLRLKKLARAQSASTIQNIARPVNDRIKQSGESRKKMEGARQREMGIRAMQNLEGDGRGLERGENEVEEEDPWMNDPKLAGLMTYRENSSQLSRITGAKSKTRASAGYAQASQSQGVMRETQEDMASQEVPPRWTLPTSQCRPDPGAVNEEGDEENSDDLGNPSQFYYRSLRAPSRTIHKPTASKTSSLTGKRTDSLHSLKAKSSAEDVRSKPSIPSNTTSRNANSHPSLDLNDFDGIPQRQALSSRALGRLGKRKDDAKEIESKKRREEVPTFLF